MSIGGGIGRAGRATRNAYVFGQAIHSPIFRSLFFRQLAIITGLIPVIGPFCSKVFNAVAADPHFDFGDFMREIFSAGLGQVMKLVLQSAITGLLPPGASSAFAKVVKIAGPIAGQMGGQALGTSIVKSTNKLNSKARDAKEKSLKEYNER